MIIVLAVLYGLLSLGLLLRHRRRVRDGLVTPFDELVRTES